MQCRSSVVPIIECSANACNAVPIVILHCILLLYSVSSGSAVSKVVVQC